MPETKKTPENILEDIRVFEVSLVSKPAIYRNYLLTKAADGDAIEVEDGSEEEVLQPVGKTAGNPPANQGVNQMNEKLQELLQSAELSDEAREAITGAMETLISNKEAVPADTMKGFYELAGYEVPEKIVEKVVEKIVEVEKPAPETDDQTILKGISDDKTRVKFETLLKERDDAISLAQKSAEKAQKVAEEEKELRILKEFAAVATKEYPNLPEKDGVSLGSVLKAIDENLDKEDAEYVRGIFGAAQASIVASKQFEQVGSPADGDDKDYDAKAQALAKKMVDDGDAESVDAAIAVLFETKQELFR
jgi:hypothetical protein